MPKVHGHKAPAKIEAPPVKTETAAAPAPVTEAEPVVAKDGVARPKEVEPAKEKKNQELDANAQVVTADHAKTRGLGFGVTEGTELPAAVAKALEDAGPQISGAEMAAVLTAFDKAGVGFEAVADQVIAGTFPGGKHELTLDGLGAIVEQLTKNGVPKGATPSQAKAYTDRIDALAAKIDANTTAVDGDTKTDETEGKKGPQPKVTPELITAAHAAVGDDNRLSKAELENLSGPMRLAAEELFKMGGPDAQINSNMLTIATAQVMVGMPAVPPPLPPEMHGPGPLALSNMSMFELARQVANSDTYSPMEQQLLATIKDPQQRAVQELQMMMQKQALISSMLTNLANMRHEMMKSIAMNLRG